MPWREIIFTDDGVTWPARPAAMTDSERHGHALAHARCISEEERVLLDLLEPTTVIKSLVVDLPETQISRCSSAASRASTPAISRCGSATME